LATCSFTVAPTNFNVGRYSFIGNGFQNVSRDSEYVSVLNGFCNYSNAAYSTILNGCCNINICSEHSIIGSGCCNTQNYGNNSLLLNGCCNYNNNNNNSVIIGGFNLCLCTNGAASNFILGGRTASISGLGNNTLTNSSYSSISGTYANSINTSFGTAIINPSGYSHVLGACSSQITGCYSSLVGGGNNFITSNRSFISGGCCNLVSNVYSTISNGQSQIISGCNSFIGNGCCNINSNSFGFVGNGFKNLNQGQYSLIGNGICNQLCNSVSGCCALGSVIVGGVGNGTCGGTWDLATCTFTVAPTIFNTGRYSFIGGGRSNVNAGFQSIIVGGVLNKIACGNSNIIVGGQTNTVSQDYFGTIVGGFTNSNTGQISIIGAGQYNSSSGYGGGILTGCNNTQSGVFGITLGGNKNQVTNTYGVVGNGFCNIVSNCFGSIVNGCCNINSSLYGSILNGTKNNVCNAEFSTISNGYNNIIVTDCISGILGGCCNRITPTNVSCNSFIGYGFCNTISNNYDCSATIVNCICNCISSSSQVFIGTGFRNKIQFDDSVIVGGNENCITAQYGAILNGKNAKAYAIGQHTNSNGSFNNIGDNQSSKFILWDAITTDASGTANLFLDGAGVELAMPNNTTWNVNVAWTIVVATLGTGTTTISVGSSHVGNDQFFAKNLAGTITISAQTNVSSHNDTGMGSSDISYSASGSNLRFTFLAPPSPIGGTATTYYVNAVVTVSEIGFVGGI